MRWKNTQKFLIAEKNHSLPLVFLDKNGKIVYIHPGGEYHQCKKRKDMNNATKNIAESIAFY